MLRRKHCSAKTQVLKTSVPYGSTKVEYLESPFNSYITGDGAWFECGQYTADFLNGDKLKFQTEHKISELPDTNWSGLGSEGLYTDGASLTIGVGKETRLVGQGTGQVSQVNGYYAAYDTNGGSYGTLDWAMCKPNQTLDTEWHVITTSIDKDNFSYMFDEYETHSETRDNKSWNPNSPLFVFGTKTTGLYYSTHPFLGRKKYFKFWFNDKLTRHLIPSIDKTGTPCMFDLVSRKNFYNAGTRQFIYPTASTTYSLRRPQAEWAKMTDTGVHKIYHTPIGYEGSIEEYAVENGYKSLIETESPNEEGKYYSFKWVETDDTLTTEWFEVDPPLAEEEITAEELAK